MAKIPAPETINNKTQKTVNATDLVPPEETTMLQLKVALSLKNDFKAYAAKSPYKTMSELFEACFNEYKENHPV